MLKVFVILGHDADKDEVLKILSEDTTEREYHFGDKYRPMDEEWREEIRNSDEVWVFGNCRPNGVYRAQLAFTSKYTDKDIWRF